MNMKTMGSIGLAAAMVLPVSGIAKAQGAFEAGPGTVNYGQGQIAVNGKAVSMSDLGRVRATAGQMISTGNGKAEIGLAPGVFVRLGSNSVLRMVNEDPNNAEVALERGQADVQVDPQYHQAGEVVVDAKGEGVQLIKPGVYAIDATKGLVKVFDGEAVVLPANTQLKEIKVKGGHEYALNAADGTKPHEFDRANAEDELYRWGMRPGGEERGGGYEGGGVGYGFAPAYYGGGYGLYDGFYPGYGYGYGFYPGFGFGLGYGFGGYGFGGYRGGFGGYRGGFGGGFRGGRR